jgi:hypothetical protein
MTPTGSDFGLDTVASQRGSLKPSTAAVQMAVSSDLLLFALAGGLRGNAD